MGLYLVQDRSVYSEESVSEDTDPMTAPIFSSVREINDLLTYAAAIDSYPVLPEDLAGTLLPTLQTVKQTDLEVLIPGVDNRTHMRALNDPRVCVACKIDNISVGLTDIQEQHSKLPCRCLLDTRPYVTGQFYDKSYMVRGGCHLAPFTIQQACHTRRTGMFL